MNINLFTQRFSPIQSFKQNNNNNYQSNSVKGNNLAPLKADTVSFGIKLEPRTVLSAYEEQLIGENSRLIGIATVYDAVLRLIGTNSNGIFKISNSIEHLVKDPKTAAGKVIRSGSFNVRDIIRQTAYCQDPYNLDNLIYLLNEMKVCRYVPDKEPMQMNKLIKRGYIPTEEENIIMSYLSNPKDKELNKHILPYFEEKGYYLPEVKKLLEDLKQLDHLPSRDEFYEAFGLISKKVPDLDIRLNPDMITLAQIKKLPEEYRYCIGKPQDSGYEDIQIRFVRSNVKDKKKQVPHELIILFGENYRKSKSRESHFVYSHLRKFKELGVKRFFENDKYNRLTSKAKTYIELIEKMFHGIISSNEFLNGKNKDCLGSKKTIDITFKKNEELLLDGYFEGLLEEVGRPYAKAISKTAKNKRQPLKDELEADREKIKEIRKGLKETIKAYNSGKAYEYNEPKSKVAKKTRKGKLDTEV